jgi:hypothetical protein
MIAVRPPRADMERKVDLGKGGFGNQPHRASARRILSVQADIDLVPQALL